MASWNDTFRNRMLAFERARPAGSGAIAFSVKLRVTSGCFHREHSPHAYEMIDEFLSRLSSDETDFVFEEHESGPELLVYLAVTTGILSLGKCVVELITTIIKARTDGVKKGDRPREPVELIIRRTVDGGEVREETILRFTPSDSVNHDMIEQKLLEAAKRLSTEGRDHLPR